MKLHAVEEGEKMVATRGGRGVCARVNYVAYRRARPEGSMLRASRKLKRLVL